jgi:hypothetical protein
MKCRLCLGSQNLFILQRGREWFVCPACEGKGVRVVSAPATIAITARQQKWVRPESGRTT